MKKTVYCSALLLIIVLLFQSAFAQEPQRQKVRVFLDCNTRCDFDYIRTEINIVDFVLDRTMADVHILLTSTINGGSGRNYQLIFFGQHDFENDTDTLYCSLPENASAVVTRESLIRRIKAGLMPYVSHSMYMDLVDINMKATASASSELKARDTVSDKWNYWVYNIGSDASYNLDKVYAAGRIRGNLSASRTTPDWRVSFYLTGAYNSSTYKYEENGEPVVYNVSNRDYQLSHFLGYALSDNWSLAYETFVSSNTFTNNKDKKYFATALEYGIFPYRDVNSRFFTISYRLDVRRNVYYDSTIYDKLSETIYGNRLETNLSLKQKWGNLNARVLYSTYFRDLNQFNLSMSLGFDIRLTGNLSFYTYSNGGIVRDQIYLAKGDASPQEILTRRRQLASGFNFNTSAGLNFRFGSIMNNVVNPRFRSM